MLCNEIGLPLDFIITGGEESDYNYALQLLKQDAHIIADRGYDSDEIVNHITRSGKNAIIPSRKNRLIEGAIDREVYKKRNRIEGLFGKIKQFRKIATRFEKILLNYASLVFLACSYLWLNQM